LVFHLIQVLALVVLAATGADAEFPQLPHKSASGWSFPPPHFLQEHALSLPV
jgi:hypothetical protein